MRRDAAEADRRREVRRAARGWQQAGAIDEATRAAVDAAYPDDRGRLGPVFRLLAFGFGLLAFNAFFGLFALLTAAANGGQHAFAVACLFFGVLLAGVTELLSGPLRRADSGVETASALLALVYLLVGLGLALEHGLPDRVLVATLLLLATALAALGSWRWGSSLLAAVAVIAAFVFLARLPAGRLWWLLAAAALVPLLLRLADSPALPPVHRRSCIVALVLAFCAAYAAVHVGSWDERWLEMLADFEPNPGPGAWWLRPLAVLATALMPPAVIGFGLATRRAVLLDVGIVLGVVSLGTIRLYFHVAPAWLVLVASGAAALLTALVARRFLASGAAGERAGFTAAPLYADASRQRLVELAGVMAQLGPAPRQLPPEPGLQPGGGRYGGGGATSEF